MDAGNLNSITLRILQLKGFAQIGLQECEPKDFSLFSSALGNAIDFNRHGPFVDKQSVSDLLESKARVFLGEDRKSGVAVWPDGNIGALFKDRRSKKKGSAAGELILTALNVGGIKLDCYNGFLSNLYSSFGFIPVARVKFNRMFAPDNWRSEFKEPDVVFWIHCGDTVGAVAKKLGSYYLYSTEEIGKLPCFPSYDDAYEYRDNCLVGKP